MFCRKHFWFKFRGSVCRMIVSNIDISGFEIKRVLWSAQILEIQIEKLINNFLLKCNKFIIFYKFISLEKLLPVELTKNSDYNITIVAFVVYSIQYLGHDSVEVVEITGKLIRFLFADFDACERLMKLRANFDRPCGAVSKRISSLIHDVMK